MGVVVEAVFEGACAFAVDDGLSSAALLPVDVGREVGRDVFLPAYG